MNYLVEIFDPKPIKIHSKFKNHILIFEFCYECLKHMIDNMVNVHLLFSQVLKKSKS